MSTLKPFLICRNEWSRKKRPATAGLFVDLGARLLEVVGQDLNNALCSGGRLGRAFVVEDTNVAGSAIAGNHDAVARRGNVGCFVAAKDPTKKAGRLTISL